MKVIRPTLLTTATLSASSIAENDKAQWDAGTTDAQGAQVLRGDSHRIWESSAAGNKGNDPTAADQTAWIDVGPTNRWAMFDQAVGTAAVGQGEIDVTLAPGVSVGALAVLDTDAELVRVQVSVAGTKIYDRTQSTNVSGGVIADWYAYFTAEIGKLMVLTFLDLPIIPNASIAVTITGKDPNGPVSVGTLLIGRTIDLGSTEVEPTIGILDYSVKTIDGFGVTTVTPRAWSKQMTAKSLIATTAVDGTCRRQTSPRSSSRSRRSNSSSPPKPTCLR